MLHKTIVYICPGGYACNYAVLVLELAPVPVHVLLACKLLYPWEGISEIQLIRTLLGLTHNSANGVAFEQRLVPQLQELLLDIHCLRVY